eukprot:496823-Amphidinium_carterae.1
MKDKTRTLQMNGLEVAGFTLVPCFTAQLQETTLEQIGRSLHIGSFIFFCAFQLILCLILGCSGASDKFQYLPSSADSYDRAFKGKQFG